MPFIIGVLLACAAICESRRSEARDWQAIYAFGDSYTDSGAGYLDGNGPTAIVYLAKSLNVPFTYAGATNATDKGLNFAVSGAQTGESNGFYVRPGSMACGTSEALLGRGMRTQVEDFAKHVQSGKIHFDARKTLFFLAGGLNDHDTSTETTISNLKSEIQELYNVGGRLFLVALLPVKIPAFAEVSTRLNPAIANIPDDVRPALPGIHIGLSRWGEYYDRVMAEHAKYGIVNVTDRCAGRAIFGEDAIPCTAPDAYFYFHEGHPSTAVHRIVGLELKREVQEAFP